MAPRKRGDSEGPSKKARDVGVSDVRKAARRLSRDDLYHPETGYLRPEYDTDRVYAWFQRQHKASYRHIDENGVYTSTDTEHTWRVPLGVRLCIKRPLLWTHMVKRHSWFVTWRSGGKRYRKYFSSPYAGIEFICAKAQYVDPRAALVNRNGFDIPSPLRGRIPAPWKWCPRCMNARRFRVMYPEEHFYALRKEWSETKGRYEYRDRKLRLMECRICGCTNRNSTWRRSNQPWTVRRFRRGVRRAKKVI
jgi:hypothetical protein